MSLPSNQISKQLCKDPNIATFELTNCDHDFQQ